MKPYRSIAVAAYAPQTCLSHDGIPLFARISAAPRWTFVVRAAAEMIRRRGGYLSAALAAIVVAACGSTATTRTVTVSPAHQSATTRTSGVTATQLALNRSFVRHFHLPKATYCADGRCETVTCPPANPADDWICQTSTNPAARAAVAHITPTPSPCPTGASQVVGGGCVNNDGSCPGALVANTAGNEVCPEASLP